MNDVFRYRDGLDYHYDIEQVPDDYCFSPVFRSIVTNETLPFRFTPNLEIRTATNLETAIIAQGLRRFRGDSYVHMLTGHFETDVPKWTVTTPKKFIVVSRVDFVTPHYLTSHDFQDFFDLETASRLTEIDLPIGQIFYTDRRQHFPPGIQARGIRFVGSDPTNYVVSDRIRRIMFDSNLDDDYLDQLKLICERVKHLRANLSENIELSGGLNLLDSALDLSWLSPMFTVALFAVIELLVVKGSKITSEIRDKMPVLGQKFERPLDYSAFSPASPKQVWGALYELRSCLAHGRNIDFNRGKIGCLKGKEQVLAFLSVAARRLVRHKVLPHGM